MKYNESEIISSLDKIVTPLIGRRIGTDHIHTDVKGWSYFIPAKSLHRNYPLILNHYRGRLMMVVPFEDFDMLCKGKVSVQDYVDNSFWNFGFYWGGHSVFSGVYWQPLEEGPGIHSTEKIKRYLTILHCRTELESSGYFPSKYYCSYCYLENCPFSKLETKNANASWDNETTDIDTRIDFCLVFGKKLKEKYGFKVENFYSHNGDGVLVSPVPDLKGYVDVYISSSLLIDMLYHPKKYNLEETANAVEIKAYLPFQILETGNIPESYLAVPQDADASFFYDFWKTSKKFSWPNYEKEKSVKEKNNMTLIEKISKFLHNLF